MAIIKIARFWPTTRRGSVAAAAALPVADGLDAFGSEEPGESPAGGKPVLALAPPPPAPSSPGRSRLVWLKWVAVVTVTAGVTAGGMWLYQRRFAAPPSVGRLTVETTPPGLEVTIGDQSRGLTPLTLELPAGAYVVAVGTGAQRRVLHAAVTAGATLVERLEVAAVAGTGSLRVETDPAGLAVLIDGVNKGTAPLTIADLAPGEHQVAVRGAAGPQQRTVSVRANETVSLILSAVSASTPAAASPGWVAVTSPLSLQVREKGAIVGTSEMERVMLAAGDHDLEFVNDALGYRASRRVSVTPGRTTSITLQTPKGSLSINAQPWAEVWLNGERLGVTPIGNHAVSIGSHELVFRHPELGERRSPVTVGLQQAARVGVDMRKK